MPGVNFRELRSRLPTLQVLQLLDLERLRIEWGHWRGRCPFHPHSGRPSRSLAVRLRDGRFFCHNCLRCGDLIDLWAGVRGLSLHQAALELAARFP